MMTLRTSRAWTATCRLLPAAGRGLVGPPAGLSTSFVTTHRRRAGFPRQVPTRVGGQGTGRVVDRTGVGRAADVEVDDLGAALRHGGRPARPGRPGTRAATLPAGAAGTTAQRRGLAALRESRASGLQQLAARRASSEKCRGSDHDQAGVEHERALAARDGLRPGSCWRRRSRCCPGGGLRPRPAAGGRRRRRRWSSGGAGAIDDAADHDRGRGDQQAGGPAAPVGRDRDDDVVARRARRTSVAEPRGLTGSTAARRARRPSGRPRRRASARCGAPRRGGGVPPRSRGTRRDDRSRATSFAGARGAGSGGRRWDGRRRVRFRVSRSREAVGAGTRRAGRGAGSRGGRGRGRTGTSPCPPRSRASAPPRRPGSPPCRPAPAPPAARAAAWPAPRAGPAAGRRRSRPARGRRGRRTAVRADPRSLCSSRSSGSASVRRTFAARRRSRQALTTTRCSQVVTAASPRKVSARRYAATRPSCRPSAASCGLPIVRRATAQSRSRWRVNSRPNASGSPATWAASSSASVVGCVSPHP